MLIAASLGERRRTSQAVVKPAGRRGLDRGRRVRYPFAIGFLGVSVMAEAAGKGGNALGGMSGPAKVVALAVVAAAVLAAIFLLARTDRPFEITIDREGKFSVEARQGDNFADILKAAIEKDPATVEALLSTHGYYNVKSPRLVDALARLDAAAAANQEVTAGLRRMLWDLAGPFKRPGTLAGADERLIGALDELEEVAGGTSKLFAGIWERSLERTGLFRPRSFNAEVTRLWGGPAAPPGQVFVYACPGNELVGKQMTLWTEGERAGAVTGLIVDDLQRFDCGNAGRTVEELLAGQPARLGLDGTAFAGLLGATTSEALPPRVEAKFRVHPKELTAAIRLPE
jgi:hypothetical protein